MNKLKDEILGLYDFKGRPRIFFPAANNSITSKCAEVHEHIHWVLASSTTFGLFQLVLATLESAHPSSQRRQAFSSLLGKTVQASWHVHEGLATLEEVRVLRRNEDECEENWRNSLPLMYAKALKHYESTINLFHFPMDLKWGIAYHVAQFALNSRILRDFQNDCEPEAKKLGKYLNSPISNPDHRLHQFLKLIGEHVGEIQRKLEEEVLAPFARELGLDQDYFSKVNGYPDVGDRALAVLEGKLDEKLRLYLVGHFPRVSIIPLYEIDLERANFAKHWNEYYKKKGVDLNVHILPAVAISDEKFDSSRKALEIFSNLQPPPGTILPLRPIDDLERFISLHRYQTLYCRLCPLAMVEGKPTGFLGSISIVLTDVQLRPIQLTKPNELPCVLIIMHQFRRFEKQHAIFDEQGWFHLIPFEQLNGYLKEINNKVNALFAVLDYHMDFDAETIFGASIKDCRRPFYVIPHMTAASYLALYLRWVAKAERPLKLYTIRIGTEGLTFLVGKPAKGPQFNIIAPITETTKRQLADEISRIPHILPSLTLEEYESDETRIEETAVVAEHIRQYGY